MQNDRSSSQFSLHSIVIPIYISRKEMITQKENDSTYRAISLSSRDQGGEEWKKNKRWKSGKPIPWPTTFLQVRDDRFFSIFSKIFPFNFKDRRNSTRFSSRYVTKKKRKKKGKREQKREENRGGDGRKWGRKAKETARRGGKSRAQWREWKGRRRKGWGSERKIDGGGMYHPAHSIFRVFLFCPPRQPDKGPSGEELAARYSPDQLETRCQMENSSE